VRAATEVSEPLMGIVLCLFAGWAIHRDTLLAELRRGGWMVENTWLWKIWPPYVRFVCPLLIAAVFVNSLRCAPAGAGQSPVTAVGRKLIAEKRHLVAEDAPGIDQRQVLGIVEAVGQGHQLQADFLQQIVGLVLVAAPTGGHHIFPAVAAVAGQGHDMVPGQLAVLEGAGTVHADIAVPGKQGAVAEGKAGPGPGQALATTGQDAGQLDY